MEALEQQETGAGIKDVVVEASRALAHLDADRLEELALSCKSFNRELPTLTRSRQMQLLGGVQRDLATYARILEATRVNLRVIRQLREIRMGRRGYGEGPESEWEKPESTHGNN